MLLMVGEVRQVRTTERVSQSTGETWTQTTVKLLLAQRFEYVNLAKNFDGQLPDEGEQLAVEVSVDPYVDKQGKPRYSFTAWRVADLPMSAGKRAA